MDSGLSSGRNSISLEDVSEGKYEPRFSLSRDEISLNDRMEKLIDEVQQLQANGKKLSFDEIMPLYSGRAKISPIHKDSKLIEEKVKQLCQEFGVWIEGAGDHYNSMSPIIFPRGDPDRIALVSFCFAINFYWDDKFGNDTSHRLSDKEKLRLKQIVKGLMHLLSTGEFDRENPSEHERALHHVLKEMSRLADSIWNKKFRKGMLNHVKEGLAESGRKTAADVLQLKSIDEYFQKREILSGANYCVHCTDFIFQTWEFRAIVTKLGLEEDLAELRRLVCSTAGVSNDVFSFEKEFLDEDCWYNAVPYIYLRNPEMSLADAIKEVCRLVDSDLEKFLKISAKVKSTVEFSGVNNQEKEAIFGYCDALTDLMDGSMKWSLVSHRYKRDGSMFAELEFSTKKNSTDGTQAKISKIGEDLVLQCTPKP